MPEKSAKYRGNINIPDFYCHTIEQEGKKSPPERTPTGKSVDSVLRNTLARIQESLADFEFSETQMGYNH
jgi:hypothetical protein